jgi:hypothetical protein
MKFNEWLENRLLLENFGYNFLNPTLVGINKSPAGVTFRFNFPSMTADEKENPQIDYETIRRLTWRFGNKKSGVGGGSDYSYGYLGTSFGNAMFKGMERAEFNVAKLFRDIFEKLPNNNLQGRITLPLQLPTVNKQPAIAGIKLEDIPNSYKRGVLNAIMKNAREIEKHIRMEGDVAPNEEKFDIPDQDPINQSKALAFTQGLAIMLLWMINTSAESSSGENS